MIPADIKTDVKQQEIKNWWLYLINFHRDTFSKLEMQCKAGIHIRFNLGWYSIQLDIVC